MRVYIILIIITLILSRENFCQKINLKDSVYTNSFNIDSDPSGAEVFVNDSLYGRTPIKIFNNKKFFSIRLIDSVKNQWTYDIDNTINVDKNIYALINKNYGLLGVFSSPNGADVYINDSLVGTTPMRQLKIPFGLLRIQLKKTGYLDWSEEYFLRKEYSQLIKYDVKLKRDSSEVNFSSLPTSSKIFIDNKIINNVKNNSKVLKSGIHNLFVDLENEKSRLGMDFNIKPYNNYKIVLKKNKFSIRPLLYSVVLPGIGQFSDGARTKGALIFVSTITLATATILSSVNYSKKINNYNAERINYLNAMNEYDALAARDNMNILKNDADKALAWKRIFTGLFLGAYIYNIIDVLFYHSFKDVLVLEQFNLGIIKDNSENIGEVYLHTEFYF